jgi:hypothetical protein
MVSGQQESWEADEEDDGGEGSGVGDDAVCVVDRARHSSTRSCVEVRVSVGVGGSLPRHSRTSSCVLGVCTPSGVGGSGLSMSMLVQNDRIDSCGLHNSRGFVIEFCFCVVTVCAAPTGSLLRCEAKTCCWVFGVLRQDGGELVKGVGFVVFLPRYCAAMALSSRSSSILHFFSPTSLSQLRS